MKNEISKELRKAGILFFVFVPAFLLSSEIRAQAPRPPIQKLSGLSGDVTITSPTDKQPLRYDSGTSKWINNSTLADLVAYSTTAAVNVANFNNRTLSNASSVAIDWSNAAGPKFPLGLYDASNIKSVDVPARKLYKTDGTTVLFDWSGSKPKFPTLTNSNDKAFLQTDASGDVTVVTVPSAGIIPATYNILAGDGAGNAQLSAMSVPDPDTILFNDSTLNGQMKFQIQNGNEGTAASAAFKIQAGGTAFLEVFGQNYTTVGLFEASDLAIRNNDKILISALGFTRFSNDAGTTERVRIDNGLAVGTTTDPGAGVVNVNSGYRIANAAGYNKSLVGNNTSFVSGDVPGKSSVTSTVDQTATTETAHVTYTVPANSVAVGTVFRIHASGNVDNGTTAITFTPRIRWGTVAGVQLLATPTFTASTTANTNRAYVLDATVTIRTIGATGTAVAEMRYIERSTSTTGVELVHADNSGTTAVTIDTTTGKDLVLSWALSSTTGTPHIRTISGTIEVVKP